MKIESQTCTTKEQSDRLLKLGIKAETADMHHYKWSEGYWDIQSCPPRGTESCYIPAWSLHRLIVLSGMGIIETTTDNIYDKVIQYIEYRIKCESFNKEYLEQ